MLALKKADLGKYLEASVDDSVSGPKPKLTTMVPTQLALYEWTALRYGFTVSVNELPADLKREKEAQLKEATLDRGEIVEEDLAAAPAKKAKVLTIADFLARANALCPAGIRAPLPPPVVAPVAEVAAAAPMAWVAAPWGGAAVAAAAPVPAAALFPDVLPPTAVAPVPTPMPVPSPPVAANVLMPMPVPVPDHRGADAGHPLNMDIWRCPLCACFACYI
jgi:hypothetical protein